MALALREPSFAGEEFLPHTRAYNTYTLLTRQICQNVGLKTAAIDNSFCRKFQGSRAWASSRSDRRIAAIFKTYVR